MNRVLISPDELDRNRRCVLTGRRARHLVDILGVEPGRCLRAGLLGGPLGELEVVESDAERVLVQWTETEASPRLPDLSLLLAMPRPKVLKRLWAPLASLGVKRIYLTNAERVERYYFDSHVLAPEFFHARLVEGLEQAGHTRLPAVSIHKKLKPLLDELPTGHRLLAHPDTLSNLYTVAGKTGQTAVLLAVGPEGGWTDYERTLLTGHAFEPVSLGPLTLRTDTACVALVSAIQCALTRAR